MPLSIGTWNEKGAREEGKSGARKAEVKEEELEAGKEIYIYKN